MANNFSVDPNCKAVWRFESAALLVDSIGGNTLTNNNGVTADATYYKEGAASAKFVRTSAQTLSRADASLSSGFPLKNGDTTKTASFTFWFRPTTLSASWNEMVCKYNVGYETLGIWLNNGQVVIGWGYGPISHTNINTGLTVLVNQWYHIGVVVDGVNKTLFVRLWDDTGGTASNFSNSPANALNISTAAFTIGCEEGDTTDNFDGQIDELAVFSDLLSSAEIDQIRSGTFCAGIHVYAGNIPFTATPTGTYSHLIAPHVYNGNVQFTVTPTGVSEYYPANYNFFDDFETGTLALWTSYLSVSLVSPTTPSMSGNYCAQFTLDSSYLKKTVNVAEAYASFDFYPEQEENNTGVILSFQGDAGTLGLVHFYNVGGQGYLRAYLGNYSSQVGSTGAFPFSAKCRIGVHFKPDPSAGVFEIKVNGSVVVTFSGNTGTAATIRSFQFGAQNNDSGQFYIDNVGLSNIAYPSNIFTYAGNISFTVAPIGIYAKTVIYPYAAVGGFLVFGGNASAYDVVTPAVNAFTATGSIALDGRCTLQSSIPAQATSEFQPIGSISLGGICQFDDGIVPAFLENVFVAAGSLAFPGYARLVSTFPASVEYSAKGSLKLGGWGSTLDVVYPSSLSSEFQAAGVLEIGGAGILDAPQIIVTELVAFYETGAPVLLLGSNSVVGFIIPTTSAYRAAGSLAFIGPDTSEEDVFETWALSGFTFEPSFFANYPFNSFAIRQGKAYGAGENGIFLLEGADDAGQEIVPGVRIGPHNFSTDKHKRLRLLRLGDAGVNAQVRVVADEGTPEYVTADGMGRFPVSRAVEGRELTVDVEGFEQISQIEIVTVVTSRR